MRKNQKGFSAVEGLLILVIVGLVGFISFYVVNSNHKTQKQLDSLSKSSNTTSKSTGTTSSQFVFKELGVQINLPDNLKGLSYNKNTYSSNESYDLDTPEFKQLAAKCGTSAPTGFANIYAKQGQFTSPGNEGSNGLLKQFSGRYIAYGDTLFGNPCDTSIYNQLTDMQTKLIDSLKSAFKIATEVH